MARLELEGLEKRFGRTAAVAGVSMQIPDGELVALLGPSGSGKSTLLRMVGGFEAPTAGAVRIDGDDVSRLPPERRPTGMVFQSHALWSHMSVHDNIAFGLKLRRLPRQAIREKVEAALALVGLAGIGQRRPAQLSGGQQQRVALARSLVLEPKILLLDEPFASLDVHLRERLRAEVRDIQQRLGITTLFVTHDQVEAMAVSDRIAVLHEGRLVEVGTPQALYHTPKKAFTASFLGHANLLDVQAHGATGRLPWGGEPVALSRPAQGLVRAALRPEAITMAPAAGAAAAGMVESLQFLGASVISTVRLMAGAKAGADITVSRSSAEAPLPVGTAVQLATSGPIHLLDADDTPATAAAAAGVAAAPPRPDHLLHLRKSP